MFEGAKKEWTERFASIGRMTGTENPYVLARELGEMMTENVTVVRRNDRLRKTLEKLVELKDRWKRVNVLDTGHSSNRPLRFVNQLWNMLALGGSSRGQRCSATSHGARTTSPSSSSPSRRPRTPPRIPSG